MDEDDLDRIDEEVERLIDACVDEAKAAANPSKIDCSRTFTCY